MVRPAKVQHFPTACLVAVLGLAATAVHAYEYPSVERGFKPERSFEVGDIDQVHLFNGGLTVTIPIGQRYTVGGELSYGLTLTYTSQIWDYISAHYPPADDTQTQAHPVRGANAGLGWRLSLGEYWDQNVTGPGRCGDCYIAPDGARHPFYTTLHPDLMDDGTTLYTRDGTYLRMRIIGGGREVDFPNGQIHKFDISGRLVQMRDRFGNSVNVAYGANTWTITDSQNRIHIVNLVSVPHYGQAIGSVVLGAFAGVQATYNFTYSNQTVYRSCLDTDAQTSLTIQLPLLTGVTLPYGSYSMPVSNYHLGSPGGPCGIEGILKKITFPSLGSVEWEYTTYEFPAPLEGTDQQQDPPWLKMTAGVGERTLRDAAGAPIGTSTYSQALPGGQQATESITSVTTPLGDRTDHYFLVGDEPNALYGLPFSASESAPGRPDLLRSKKIYDCAVGGTNCQLRRTTYLKYRTDSPFTGGPEFNSRVEASSTIYHDDGGRWAAVDHSDFDGLGHYRTSVTSGNFDAANTRTQTTRYNPIRGTYPGSFTMVPVASPWVLETYDLQTQSEGATAVRSLVSDPGTGWVSRTRIHRLDGGAQSTTDVVIETLHDGLGNLASERYYGGDSNPVPIGDLPSIALLQTSYRIDHTTAYGTRASSTYVDQFGSALTFKTLDCGDDPATPTIFDPGIDPWTGLASKCRDTSGIVTSFEYDLSGRPLWVKPVIGHDGWTEYVYTPATSWSALASVNIRKRANGGGAIRAESAMKFDALGRLWQEQQKMADGTWSTRETLYNEVGWKASVSEQGNTAKKTQFLFYDVFGRPGTIRPPDGSAHDVVLTYLGVQSMTRRVKVATLINSEENAFTTEFYDRQGRLTKVQEEADKNGVGAPINTTTTYTYDVGNRLSQVSIASSVGTQNRFYTYDQRGFLLSEQHPEKGSTGNGLVTYSNHDPKGHAGRRQDAPFDVTFLYDRAERLTLAHETGGAQRPLKSFTYGTSSAVGVRSNGKLAAASRFNYVGPPFDSVEVIETYTYGGRQGRTSRKNTGYKYGGAAGTESWKQTYTYTDLGELDEQGYPECTWAGCPGALPRTVDYSYSNSNGYLLTAVSEFATSISYHGNGVYDQIIHSNGVVDTQTKDLNNMHRPRELYAQLNGVDLWRSGIYQYDGAGNVKKIGNSYFLYDRVSRLVDGHLYDGPTGGGTLRYQTYAYDPFGNMKSVGGDPWAPGRSTTTSTVNNRLSSSSYHADGSLAGWNGSPCAALPAPLPANPCYEYDALGAMTRAGNGSTGTDFRYVYTANNERFWAYRVGGASSIWTLRDLDGKVLREYDAHTSWTTFKDYVYRDGQLLASSHTNGSVQHFHLDHLGTPRLVTGVASAAAAGFYTVAPCRAYDSRDQAAPLNAAATRVVGMAGICGVPIEASAVSINVTVVDATANGEMTGYPANVPRPNSSVISHLAGVTRRQ